MEISSYTKMYLLLATISTGIALYALYVLFQTIDSVQSPKPNVNVVQQQLNDTNLNATGLTQFKLLDTKSTVDRQSQPTQIPGNAEAQNIYKQYQKSFGAISNLSYLQNKDIYN